MIDLIEKSFFAVRPWNRTRDLGIGVLVLESWFFEAESREVEREFTLHFTYHGDSEKQQR